MLVIPAIDLQDGCVVRFVQGRLDKKVYSKDPGKTAKHWVRQGASLIHVVDLDGAFSGVLKNLDAIAEIVRASDVPVQCGGGVRSIEAIRQLLELGVQRVVLGTRAIQDKVFLRKTWSKFKQKIIISIDTRGNELLIKGWQSAQSGSDAISFVNLLKTMGFQQIIYTDTSKDGTLKGPNIKDLKAMLKATKMKIIASGGVSCLDDLCKLKLLEKQGLTGVIVGKALYEGKFTLNEAIKLC